MIQITFKLRVRGQIGGSDIITKNLGMDNS